MKQLYERQSPSSETLKVTNHSYLAIKCWSVFRQQIPSTQISSLPSCNLYYFSCAEYLPHFHQSGTLWGSLRTWTLGLHVRMTDQERCRILPHASFRPRREGKSATLPHSSSRNDICTVSPLSVSRHSINAVYYLLNIFNGVPNIYRPFLSDIPEATQYNNYLRNSYGC